MKKVVVIGGGTAGWLTALFVNKFWEGISVSVIESTKTGILGAGEGTTPNFPYILVQLGIDLNDFMEKTGSTKKYGIDFRNWRGDGHWFPHNFQADENVHALHFDARLVAKYFREFAYDNTDIKHIDSFITDINEDENGINQVILEDGSLVDCDFVFDCSGFARLVIGKHFKSEWKSYSNDLLCNAAFAYFLPQKDNVTANTRTMTQSISMPNGWMWQAPLQHRWGCGYVYNDKYISLEDAVKEVEEYVGQKIEVVKTFKFDAGSYERMWIKNCIAVGLASSFLEPLEATSLMTVIIQLKQLKDFNFDEKNRDVFNITMSNVNEQNMLFIRHHYNCDRYDTKFWRDYKRTKQPEKLLKLYNDNVRLKNLSNIELYKIMVDPNGKASLMFNRDSFATVFKGKSALHKELI